MRKKTLSLSFANKTFLQKQHPHPTNIFAVKEKKKAEEIYAHKTLRERINKFQFIQAMIEMRE
jgi:hypothetical protein